MLSILYILPKNILSSFIGCLANLEHPAALAKLALRIFVNFYKIDLKEIEKPLDNYSCIGSFFIRNLKEGARLSTGPIVSPADGILRDHGQIKSGALPQVKNKNYSIDELLGDANLASKFTRGYYYNIYLTPRHYHQVHSPITGLVSGFCHIPGNLWPVNDWSLNKIDRLFCVNERLVTYIESEFGLVALVMIGATNVGSMTVTYDPIVTNQNIWFAMRKPRQEFFKTPAPINCGQKLGAFNMGSSVVLLFENSQLFSNLAKPGEIRIGQALAQKA